VRVPASVVCCNAARASLLALTGAAVAFVALPALAAACAVPSSDSFTGRVVAVLDGDSLKVLRDGAEVEVRLLGVDAPEGGQAFGSVSKRALSNLVFGRTVHVAVRELDRYGRSVARVTVEGTDVGLELVRGGFAWHYTRYLDDAAYAAAQREAQSARRGLWQDPAPVAPWEYRPRSTPGSSKPPPVPRASNLVGSAQGAGAARSAAGPFHGNVTSRVFHGPGCGHYNCRNCTAVFATYDAAVAAGYRPHSACAGR
jgi:micrococcal nuclease